MPSTTTRNGDGFDGSGAASTEELDPEPESVLADVESEFDRDASIGGGGSLFDDDFGSALQDAPSLGGADAPEGFADVDFGLPGGDQQDFDEEVDSDLPRIDLGIDGLDRMIQGGVPERSLMVAMGSAGTGKTTSDSSFSTAALRTARARCSSPWRRPVGACSTARRRRGTPSTSTRPTDDSRSSTSIRDSVSLLEMMYDDRAKRRNEIYDFTRSLKDAGVTALLTSEASEESPYVSRYGIVEYLTDAVFVLLYVRPDDFRETRLAVEIQKIRDANHSREKKPYEITGEGISVYQHANLF